MIDQILQEIRAAIAVWDTQQQAAWERQEGIYDGVCTCCGEVKKVVVLLDPYALEVDGISMEVVYCRQCYELRCDDI